MNKPNGMLQTCEGAAVFTPLPLQLVICCSRCQIPNRLLRVPTERGIAVWCPSCGTVEAYDGAEPRYLDNTARAELLRARARNPT